MGFLAGSFMLCLLALVTQVNRSGFSSIVNTPLWPFVLLVFCWWNNASLTKSGLTSYPTGPVVFLSDGFGLKDFLSARQIELSFNICSAGGFLAGCTIGILIWGV